MGAHFTQDMVSHIMPLLEDRAHRQDLVRRYCWLCPHHSLFLR